VKARGKEPLGRPRRRWLDNIVEVGWGDVDWIGLAQDTDRWRALVNSVLNLLNLYHDILSYTECFKNSFTTLKAYINLFRGYVECFELSCCSKTHEFYPG
jgi:hypothetical protein